MVSFIVLYVQSRQILCKLLSYRDKDETSHVGLIDVNRSVNQNDLANAAR